jgi:hypothetical protein
MPTELTETFASLPPSGDGRNHDQRQHQRHGGDGNNPAQQMHQPRMAPRRAEGRTPARRLARTARPPGR